jgi:hypothetical protein
VNTLPPNRGTLRIAGIPRRSEAIWHEKVTAKNLIHSPGRTDSALCVLAASPPLNTVSRPTVRANARSDITILGSHAGVRAINRQGAPE